MKTTVHGIAIKCHSAAGQLSGPYLTKVIILSHFLCIRSWSNGGVECLGGGRGGGIATLTLTSHMICDGELSSLRLKINLSCQQHDGPSAPDLYSEQFVLPARAHARREQGGVLGTGRGGGRARRDMSPCRCRAVTDPPSLPHQKNMKTCQSKRKSISS